MEYWIKKKKMLSRVAGDQGAASISVLGELIAQRPHLFLDFKSHLKDAVDYITLLPPDNAKVLFFVQSNKFYCFPQRN